MAKSSRIKVPKRIVGVKIPKAVRKGPAVDFLNSSAGKLLLAEALVAAVGLFTAKQITDTPAGEAVRHPVDTLQRAGRKVSGAAGDAQAAVARNTARLQFAFGEAVRAFREALAEPGTAPLDPGKRIEPEVEAGKSDAGKSEAGKKKNWSPADPTTPH